MIFPNKFKFWIWAAFVFMICSSSVTVYSLDRILLNNYSSIGNSPIKSWKTLRDERVVKQQFDYSCGAASLATILNEFYGQSVTEMKLLKAIDNGNMRASFSDMKNTLGEFGFRAEGFATSYEQLAKLRIPVLVYLKYRRDDHFSVLRGIDHETVWLADSSLGNRTFSKHQFMEMWDTRNSELSGKFLAILPTEAEVKVESEFFMRQPTRFTAGAVQLQAFRTKP